LRKGPYQTNILLGGLDKGGESLYFIDMYSALVKVNFGVHGHASNFLLSVFDRTWKVVGLQFCILYFSLLFNLSIFVHQEDMTIEEGVDVIKKCIAELKTRFLISQPNFMVKVVDADGVRVLDLNDF
jgi:20S proteasome subunit beta 4